MISNSNIEPSLRVKRLSENATLPRKGSSDAAGFDLCSSADMVIPASGRGIVPTDLSIATPPGTYGRIAPRSGLAAKKSIDVGAGVIDIDYRGPVGIILFNHGDTDFEIKRGDRVAQLILERISYAGLVEVDNLDETERGEDGFGSTGVHATENGSNKKLKGDAE
eukprot:CAMPEP_0194270302 /NCGR_PEP_ID=MMETSP0169-20130528/4316_1 /TAXON_ID=218684 /ORGANISM="Corethron pennatum, Strain L29A3" /LENGTH=164 /DNA_ID=CAMNT_0039012303 /DNA_START=153 /DNA_END=647 /DNA_ORIENTATION=-